MHVKNVNANLLSKFLKQIAKTRSKAETFPKCHPFWLPLVQTMLNGELMHLDVLRSRIFWTLVFIEISSTSYFGFSPFSSAAISVMSLLCSTFGTKHKSRELTNQFNLPTHHHSATIHGLPQSGDFWQLLMSSCQTFIVSCYLQHLPTSTELPLFETRTSAFIFRFWKARKSWDSSMRILDFKSNFVILIRQIGEWKSDWITFYSLTERSRL